MSWQCPFCDSQHLVVTVLTSANLLQDTDGDNFETEIEGDHEWDQGSSMECKDCRYVGSAIQFECNRPLRVDPEGPLPNPNRRHTDG